VMDAPTAALHIQLGADFVVSPVLNPEMARVCNRRKIPFSPGCATTSEISAAEELGVEIVKIFPGTQVGGPAFVKAIRAPMPWTYLMPTGGVSPTEENLRAWFEAGVACVGMGSKLIRKDLVEAGNFDEITRMTTQALAWIRGIREEHPLN
jgi:2-dehydro-3-deoxyphosphogluconate aldolase/(4S)-4-hydroxy-2-oxoglutarate aldolase